MSIVRIEGLSPEAKAVEERAIEAVRNDLDGLTKEYRNRFGVHVGTDFARELFPDYMANLDSKLKYAPAVQRSAAAIADEAFKQILVESNGGPALFTAGGTGAGKTTSILRNGAANRVLQAATVIFDSNFNSYNSSKDKVELALAADCKVVVIFVHRHPVEAYLQGVLPRAIEQGRTVPIEGHLRIHRDARKTFLKVHKHFGNNGNVSFMVLSNTGHEAESFTADIDYLRAVNYDDEALHTAIKEGLDCAFNEQKITESIYVASCGTPRAT